jgi:O-antigen ligase
VQSPGIVLRNEATQAIYFAVTAALAAWLARARSGSVRFAYAGLALALAASVAFLGASRSGYVALGILALGFALSATSTKARVLAVLACVAGSVVVAAASPVAQQRVKEGWQQVLDVESAPEASSMGVRLAFWSTSLDLIVERPALGYGVDGLRTAYACAVADREGWRRIRIADPHN